LRYRVTYVNDGSSIGGPAMARTFGEYLKTRRISRVTVNPAFIRRIQAAPGLGNVTNFDELLSTLGNITPGEQITIKGFWRTYRKLLAVRSSASA
jgi:hypothetical protein